MRNSFIKINRYIILMALLVGASLLTATRAHSQEDDVQITATGTLEILISEDLRQEGQPQILTTSYFLNAGNGVSYQLQFNIINPPANLRTGQRATVTGIANGTQLYVETLTSDPLPQAPAVGNRRAVVLLVDLQDVKASSRYTVQQVSDLMYSTTARSVRELYLKGSFNQLNFVPDTDGNGTPDVFGPFLINYSYAPDNNCDYYNWALAAEVMAGAQGIDLSRYQHRVFVLPRFNNIPSCSFSGIANVGCEPACRTWIAEGETAMIYAHELGHNLGLGHAGNDPQNDGIIDNAYGDYSDPMGGSRSWHWFNAANVDKLGWYAPYPGSIGTVTQSGSYTLAPLSVTPPANPIVPRVLKVQRPNNLGYYYFSYRQPVDYDDSPD